MIEEVLARFEVRQQEHLPLDLPDARELVAEIHQLRAAVKAFLAACETDVELMDNNADLFDAYEQASKWLGDPIKSYPGGYEDTHYHKYGWKPEEGCDTCEDYREEQAAGAAAAGSVR